MMDGYCKLHSKIITSSIWSEPDHVRILWITLLAAADGSGHVEGSVGGLAHMARISADQCRDALAVLAGPDEDSGDETTGERIRKVAPGVWEIINHGHYRERQTRRQAMDAERKRQARAKQDTPDADMSAMSAMSVDSVYVSVSEEEEKASKPKRKPAVLRPDDVPEQAWEDWLEVRRAKKAGKVTETVMARMRSEAGKAKVTLAAAIEEAASRGWQAFRADWLKSKFAKPEGASHAVPVTRHNSAWDVGDDRCDCLSCKAVRRDRRAS